MFFSIVFQLRKKRFVDDCWSQKELQKGPEIDKKLVKKYTAKCRALLVTKKGDKNRKTIKVRISRPLDKRENTVKP